MQAIKKINNNVAVCIDGNGRELVAFGNGIGFPSMPYELALDKVDRTFYNINQHYLDMLPSLPSEIVNFCGHMITFAQNHLSYQLNPNLLVTLADHIAFAIERAEKNIYVQMPLSYDMEQHFPEEMKLARYLVKKLQERLNIKLNSSEVTGIAMSFVNARMESKNPLPKEEFDSKFTKLLSGICKILEKEMNISINKHSFVFTRFATHMRYLFDRIYNNDYIDTDNGEMLESFEKEFPRISECTDHIISYLNKELDSHISSEEKLYLMLHVNRLYTSEGL